MTGLQHIFTGAILLCATGFTLHDSPVFKTSGTLYLEDEDFASNPFGFTMSVEEIQKRYSDVFVTEKDPVENIHEEDVTDTVYTFRYHQTIISVYKSSEQDILQSAVIRDKDILLKRNIYIGMTKKAFAQGFNNLSENCPDYLEVGNAENTSVYGFSFKNSRLHEVRYLGYVD
jgi:hypothetical protein